MGEARDGDAASSPPEVCRSCRFGSGAQRDCVLIETGRLDRLVAEGPCGIEARVQAAAAQGLERRGLAPELAEDRCDALLARLADRRTILAQLGMRRLPEFEDWLRSQLAALLDEGVADQPARAPARPAAPAAAPAPRSTQRCGACRHYRRAAVGACDLEFVGADAADLEPNPWWGRRLDRDTDPLGLEPRCESFSPWAPGELDPFAGLIDQKPAASRRDEAARLLALGLDRLAQRGETGLAAAALLRAHLLEGRSHAELAAASRLDEITVARLVEGARDALSEILAAEIREGPAREH